MNKGLFMVRWNQLISFSPLMAASRPAAEVFWPGCAAMKLEPRCITFAYSAMKQELPGLGFSSWCCGKPTFAVDSERQRIKRENQLKRHLEIHKIKKVYTLCPNCLVTLRGLQAAEAASAWPLLERCFSGMEKHGPENYQGRYLLHDPCVSRTDAASQQAVRGILNAGGISWGEFAHSETRCCGRRDMLFLTRPELSGRILRQRIDEAAGFPIITYCESCVEAFRGAGTDAFHLLEVMLDTVSGRSVFHRIQNARTGGTE